MEGKSCLVNYPSIAYLIGLAEQLTWDYDQSVFHVGGSPWEVMISVYHFETGIVSNDRPVSFNHSLSKYSFHA